MYGSNQCFPMLCCGFEADVQFGIVRVTTPSRALLSIVNGPVGAEAPPGSWPVRAGLVWTTRRYRYHPELRGRVLTLKLQLSATFVHV